MWSQASLKEIAARILPCLTSSRRGQKYSSCVEGCDWGGGTIFVWHISFSPPQPSHERSFWCSTGSRHRLSSSSQDFSSGPDYWDEPESTFSSFWLTGKISPAGTKSHSHFRELYQVLAKEVITSIRFLCSASFDAFAQLPGLDGWFWLSSKKGQRNSLFCKLLVGQMDFRLLVDTEDYQHCSILLRSHANFSNWGFLLLQF